MKTTHKSKHGTVALLAGCFVFFVVAPGIATKDKPDAGLTPQGEKLAAAYAQQLKLLQEQITAELPAVDPSKKAAFLDARAAVSKLEAPAKDAGPEPHRNYEAETHRLDAAALDAARDLLIDLEAFLDEDKLDGKLMTAAILYHGSPAGLAKFAQQGETEKALLDRLFADEALMKQVLVAGGASRGRYGEAMQIYDAILKASERARERGTIFQRLALGTSLELAGTVQNRVERYQHYEKAYLDGELDPAFPDMTAWECRFITNGSRSNEDLAWMRQMLRNFRPDHVTNPDYKWRYTRIVKSDFPYRSIRKDPTLGTGPQQALALGGSCGPRAWFGRAAARAFGIPCRKHPQTGHAAMSHWTPTGWVVNFGGWWSVSPGGLDFYLDSQAREFPDGYMQVLRAQWIADVLDEEDVSTLHYGKGGGLWNSLAFYKKRVLVADKKLSDDEIKLAKLSSEESRLLGESDDTLDQQEINKIEISEDDKQITVAEDGTITLPAVACTRPDNNTDKVAFLTSWDKGMQLHYQRLGNQPEILGYDIEVPSAGTYELLAIVSTVSQPQIAIARVNRRTLVDLTVPYTKGMWEQTPAETIELREGRNSIMLTFRAGNRGVSIKEFQLRPVK